MVKITSLHQANEYLKDNAVYLWQKENEIHLVTFQGTDKIPLRYPEFVPCKSMAEAFARLTNLAHRHRLAERTYKDLSAEDKKAIRDFWQDERDHYKLFNSIVQGYNPPHQ